MKVLHVIPSVSPVAGGPTAAMRTLAHGLSEAGVDVSIATLTDTVGITLRASLKAPVHEDGYTTWYFQRNSKLYATSWSLAWWLAHNVKRYDLVHIHGLFSFPGAAAAFWATRYHIPYIVRPYGTLRRWGMKNKRAFLKKLSIQLVEGPVLRHAQYVQFTSLQEERDAMELGIGGTPVVIPHGVDLDRFCQLPPRNMFAGHFPELVGKQILLSMSRLHPIKGLELLFEALSLLQDDMPELVLVVAGTGEPQYEQDLRLRVEQLGICERVHWVGFLEGERKLQAWAAADVFVLPSYSENFGIAVLEAMAAGLPVVVSDQVGLADYLLAAEAGLVVRHDARQLADAIAILLGNSSVRDSLVTNAEQLVLEQFSTTVAIRKLISLYEQAITLYRTQSYACVDERI